MTRTTVAEKKEQLDRDKKLLAVMRKIRPMMPGNVVKKGDTTFEVDGKIIIDFNYFCTWDPKTNTRKKECTPTSIIIRPVPIQINSYSWAAGAVFKTKTINRSRTTQEFNYDRVGVQITSALRAVADYRKKIAADEAKKRADKRAKKAHEAKLAALLGKTFSRSGIGRFTKRTSIYRQDISISIQYPSAGIRKTIKYKFEVDELDLATVKRLLKVL